MIAREASVLNLKLDADKIIKDALDSNKAIFNKEKYGEPEIGNIMIYSGDDGFCLPEIYFDDDDLPKQIKRIRKPY
jgi:hypothetical protein